MSQVYRRNNISCKNALKYGISVFTDGVVNLWNSITILGCWSAVTYIVVRSDTWGADIPLPQARGSGERGKLLQCGPV